MSTASESFSKRMATLAGLSKSDLGLKSFSEDDVKALQKALKVEADGWLGGDTIDAFKKANAPKVQTPGAGFLILNGAAIQPPEGLVVVNFEESRSLRATVKSLSPRTEKVNQLVIHRGSQAVTDGARHTLSILEGKRCSTTFIVALDGTIYQTFDPAKFEGRHCIHHNGQSDAIDFAGPVQIKTGTGQEIRGVKGQELWALPLAIGREDDNIPPAKRKVVTTRQWCPTPAQQDVIAKFIPWWCSLRKIPLKACADPRTFRLGGLGPKDPISKEGGIFGHIQIAGPGTRVDGAVEIEALKRASDAGKIPEHLAIEWIPAWA